MARVLHYNNSHDNLLILKKESMEITMSDYNQISHSIYNINLVKYLYQCRSVL
jgi:hypothetical protein